MVTEWLTMQNSVLLSNNDFLLKFHIFSNARKEVVIIPGYGIYRDVIKL